jgi:hypothetical protein
MINQTNQNQEEIKYDDDDMTMDGTQIDYKANFLNRLGQMIDLEDFKNSLSIKMSETGV